MKTVYNTQGESFLEDDLLPVKTINGKHYYLTESDLAELEARAAEHAATRVERKLKRVRAIRAPLLVEADYKVNYCIDNGLNPTDWSNYRQALRDVTNQEDLDNIVWPAKPE